MARITLAQILDTACRLFAQRGIQAVTTAHVAQA
ncbi:MAG: TetR family transcriptional regulator, partial [Hymenobacter sp.]